MIETTRRNVRPKRWGPRWVRFLALAISLHAPHANADDVRVFVASAAREAIERIAPAYMGVTGDRIVPTYDTVGTLRDRIAAGERPDAAILSRAAVDQLRGYGATDRGPAINVGKAAVVVVVRRATPVPDISTHERFVDALLAADSIAYVDSLRGSASGTHFEQLLDTLGLRGPLSDRLRALPSSEDVLQAVAEGRASLAVVESSEIVGRTDVLLAGKIPAPDGLNTLYAAATIGASARGGAFVTHLASQAARAHFRSAGWSAP